MARLPSPRDDGRAFATERSHDASKIAYDLNKATAQACLLINGGAATAVIAFLTKEKVDIAAYTYVPLCLALYALGVLASAVMLFCIMMNADYWNYYWFYTSYEHDKPQTKHCEKIANRWQRGMYTAFIAAALLFILSSALMAYALFHVQPPT
jgi:hypothetical protein